MKKIHFKVDNSLLWHPACRAYRVGLDNYLELAKTMTKEISKVTCKRCLAKKDLK